MPDIALVIDPGLRVSAEAFAAAWNADPASAALSTARADDAAYRTFDPTLSTAALALLGAIGTEIVASALYDLIKAAIRRAREARTPLPSPATPGEVVDITETTLPNGTRLLIVTVRDTAAR
jgi:hypothetical protein